MSRPRPFPAPWCCSVLMEAAGMQVFFGLQGVPWQAPHEPGVVLGVAAVSKVMLTKHVLKTQNYTGSAGDGTAESGSRVCLFRQLGLSTNSASHRRSEGGMRR